ncbi:MAG: DUF3011 domain-containing protein [Bryobacteraceae bacterium]
MNKPVAWTAKLAKWGLPLCVLIVPFTAFGQERVRCASSNGSRTVCEVDMRNATVKIDRTIAGSRCDEGRSWGVTDRGIWVDRGCRADFIVTRLAQRGRWDRWDNNRNMYTRLEPGTDVVVRTNEPIQIQHRDTRIFSGTVDQNVLGENNRIAIPRGAQVELIVRELPDRDLVLDLDSIIVKGNRYAIDTQEEHIDSRGRGEGVGANERTGKYVGGGAVVGTILGAIFGGGKGAAIGAAAGAAAGAGTQVVTRGRTIRIPAESLLTFRLDAPLDLGPARRGGSRDGRQNRDPRNPQ